jgi:spore germination cell wall hydrolase CwlJ-like protein
MFTERSFDHHVLARTLWGEARGEPHAGQVAVAKVILNRATDPKRRWPRSVAAVCLQPYQFSCWTAGDPNRAKLLQTSEARMAEVYLVALEALGLPDLTLGANHYLTRALALDAPPRWYQAHKVTVLIGAHAFLRL